MKVTRQGFLKLSVAFVAAAAGLASACSDDATTPATGGTGDGGAKDSDGGSGNGGGGGGGGTGGDAAAEAEAPDGGSCDANGATSTTETNHNSNAHAEITVPAADFTAPAEKTYPLGEGGGANNRHSHSVTLSAADFAALASGGSVKVASSEGGGHTHMVLVFCA